MAEFQIAFSKLKELEGGYSNNPADHGGETFIGISRVSNPHWPGWAFIDRIKPDHPNLVELNRELFANPILVQLVENFYQQTYWKFDALDQDVADKVFDIEINFGRSKGVRILQEALNDNGSALSVDGSLGPQTIAAASTIDKSAILLSLRALAGLEHCLIVLRNPDQQVFLKGWLHRDAS